MIQVTLKAVTLVRTIHHQIGSDIPKPVGMHRPKVSPARTAFPKVQVRNMGRRICLVQRKTSRATIPGTVHGLVGNTIPV